MVGLGDMIVGVENCGKRTEENAAEAFTIVDMALKLRLGTKGYICLHPTRVLLIAGTLHVPNEVL
jgi:hypothetical protein